jgi:cyclopropane fatty-acyl-phospholipid synthase-like methyltransferase
VTGKRNTFQPAYFDAIYAADPDPWKFASSAYEREKYAITIASLPKAHYECALEIGCSIGILTRKLASRCSSLLAIDAASTALPEARRRCANLPNVQFNQMFVPDEWPDKAFELIVLSEVVYFMDTRDVARLAARVARSLNPGGDVVLVHWIGVTNYPLGGDEAAELFIDFIGQSVQIISRKRFDSFRLDVLSRA